LLYFVPVTRKLSVSLCVFVHRWKDAQLHRHDHAWTCGDGVQQRGLVRYVHAEQPHGGTASFTRDHGKTLAGNSRSP
jgi:hypothetical protein